MNNAITNYTRIANTKKMGKINKYSTFHNSNILKDSRMFIPLVFVLPGYFEEDAHTFINKVCSYISEQHDIPISNLQLFLRRKLIFSLLKSLSKALITNNCKLQNRHCNPIGHQEYNQFRIIDSTSISNDNNNVIIHSSNFNRL